MGAAAGLDNLWVATHSREAVRAEVLPTEHARVGGCTQCRQRPNGGVLEEGLDGFPTRAVELWFAFAAADDAPPPQDIRLKAYGFVGAAQQIGVAWLDGHLPLTIDEVIDQLVDMFYRISGIAPRPSEGDTSS